MKKNHNVLIIGAGKIGSRRARIAKKLFPGTKLFIHDINYKQAIKLAKEVKGEALKSLQKVLTRKDIDIAVVAVVNKHSKKLSINALKSGKHVLCEKPMGVSYKEAKEIYKAAKKYKKKFKCGFNNRYHNSMLEAYKLCKKNKIGKILFIRATYGHGGRKGYEKEWRAKKSLSGGGQLLDQGSHLIDLCHWFFNFEDIKKIYCIQKPLFWKMKVEDNAFVLFETKKGKIAQIHASWTQWKNLFRFEIFGTKGSVEVEGLGGSYGEEKLKVSVRNKPGKPPLIYEKRYKYDKSWELEWKDFIKSIDRNTKIMSNENESLKVMKTISALYNP